MDKQVLPPALPKKLDTYTSFYLEKKRVEGENKPCVAIAM